MALYATSFLCGATIMLLEIVGFRLLPPYFGYAMPVWGSLLGVVMVALSLGYYGGGALADRRPDPRTLYGLVVLAAVSTLGLLVAYPAVLRFAARFDLVTGSVLASLLLFAVPVAALSTVSPFLTRLLARDGAVGRAAGTIYAVSTLGSIAGTFLTSFYLVPTIGTRASLIVAVASLTLVGGLGLLASRQRAPAPVRLPVTTASAPPRVPPAAVAGPSVRPSASPPGAGLELAGLALLGLGLVASGFSPPILFELPGRDQVRWTERFASGQDEAVVDVRDRDARVPYILPGPADDWAGGKPHRARIHFAVPAQESILLLNVPDAHAGARARLAVSVNGREVGYLRLRRGTGDHPLAPRSGPPLEYVLRIPAAALDGGGAQTLTITNRDGGWAKLSAVTLLSAAPTFALAHYLDPSPPSHWALVAVGLGLFGLWAAHGRRAWGHISSLLVLGGGFALLLFLSLAATPVTRDWHVVLVTHRAIWLLLILSFAVALAPRLPRFSGLRFAYVVAFVIGAVGMILEVAGFRLLAPYFGYSIYVWGSLLGVIMGALAVGYYVGGWLADRRQAPAVLRQTLLGTAMLILVGLYAYPFIVRLTVNLSLVSGSLLATLLLVFLPMVGMGLAMPLLVRVASTAGDVGISVGRIYAMATVGSLVGTLASAFFLVAALGAQESWVAAGLSLLLLLSVDGTARGLVGVHWLGLILVFAQPFVPETSVAALKGGTRIYETESDYSHLEVIEVGKTVQLVPSLRFVHTIYDEERVFEPVITYGLLPSFLVDEPRTMLHLGMGAGALSRVYFHAHPDIRVDGVDIDREMIRLGQRFLGLREDPRLAIFVEDARAHLLRAPPVRYDVIVWDLFQGGVFVPYYALTREFFELARERLDDRGVIAVFVARPGGLDAPARRQKFERLFKAVGNTLAAVYPSVFSYPVTRIGYYFVATRQATSIEGVRARLEAADRPEVRRPLRAALRGLVAYQPDPAVPVLTDDLAPVDQLVYQAFFPLAER